MAELQDAPWITGGGGSNPPDAPWAQAAPTAGEAAIDVIKQVPSSIVSGVAGIPGQAAKLWGMAGRGAEYLAGPGEGERAEDLPWYRRLFAGDPEAIRQREEGLKAIEQQRKGMEQYLPEPQTEWGRSARNIGEVAAGSLGVGPWRGAIAAGAGSEALGRAAETFAPTLEPYARAAGAVIGGAKGAYAGERAGAELARRQLLDVEAPFGTKQLYANFDRVAQGTPVDWQMMSAGKQQMRNALAELPYDTALGEKLVTKLSAPTVDKLNAWRQGMRDTLYSKGEGASAQALTGVVDRMIDQSLPAGGPGASLLQQADRQFALTRLAQGLDKRISVAEGGTAATHSGANLDNKIRQAFQAFKKDERAWHALTGQEQLQIDGIIAGSPWVNGLRTVSNLFGGGGGLGMAAAGYIGHTVIPGWGAFTPVIGKVLKHFENRATENAARNVLASVAGRSAFAVGSLAPSRLRISSPYWRPARAAVYGGLAPALTPEGYPYYQR